MEALQNLRNEVQTVKAAIDGANDKLKQLAQKRADVESMAADINEELKELRNLHKRAVEMFARNEVKATELDKFPAKIAELEARQKSLISVLEIIASDTAEATTAKQNAVERQRKTDIKFWREITQIELAKAAPFLRRAFAAALQTRDHINRPTASEFLGNEAYEVAFTKQKEIQPVELKEEYQF